MWKLDQVPPGPLGPEGALPGQAVPGGGMQLRIVGSIDNDEYTISALASMPSAPCLLEMDSSTTFSSIRQKD